MSEHEPEKPATPVQVVDGILRPVPWDGSDTEAGLAELTGRVLEDDGCTEVSLADLREMGLLRIPSDNASLPSDGNDARPAATATRGRAHSEPAIAEAGREERGGDHALPALSAGRVWDCKIGFAGDIPSGADLPMRRAVRKAFVDLTGHEPKAIVSGWGGEFSEEEMAVIEDREPRRGVDELADEAEGDRPR